MPTPETPKAEIHYIVKDHENVGREEFENIIAAMGAFEEELERWDVRAHPEVELYPKYLNEENNVLIALSRNISGRRTRAEAIHDTDVMRSGVEKHFKPADREILSGRFAGIIVPDNLETE